MKRIYLYGVELGIEERKRSIETARNLIKEFRPIKEIARVTNLSIETILQLYENLQNLKSPLLQ